MTDFFELTSLFLTHSYIYALAADWIAGTVEKVCQFNPWPERDFVVVVVGFRIVYTLI